VAARRF